MAERESQLSHAKPNRSIHERAGNVICEGGDGGRRGYAQWRGTFECWDYLDCSRIRDTPLAVYGATVCHSSPLFENHVEKPSLLGPSLV